MIYTHRARYIDIGTDLGFDLVGVPLGELLLAGSGDQDVAVRLQDAALVGGGVREAYHRAVGLETTHNRKQLRRAPR